MSRRCQHSQPHQQPLKKWSKLDRPADQPEATHVQVLLKHGCGERRCCMPHERSPVRSHLHHSGTNTAHDSARKSTTRCPLTCCSHHGLCQLQRKYASSTEHLFSTTQWESGQQQLHASSRKPRCT